MYTSYLKDGNIVRDSDGKVVCPCNSETDVDYLQYVQWVNEGNTPRETTVSKHDMLQALSDLRKEKESAGIVFNGVAIDTTPVDQLRINSVLDAFERGFVTEVAFKSASGPIMVDKPAITAIAQAVTAHVQACFLREAQLSNIVNSAKNLEDLETIDIYSGWPV